MVRRRSWSSAHPAATAWRRITAAFGFKADTLGVFFEKPGTETKAGTAGWYNAAAFDKFAKQAGLYSKSINGDAFSDEARAKVIELIKNEMGGKVDLVVYSLASPVRKLPQTGELVRSALKRSASRTSRPPSTPTRTPSSRPASSRPPSRKSPTPSPSWVARTGSCGSTP